MDITFQYIVWDFVDNMPSTKEEFNQAVIDKQIFNFDIADNWNPDEIITDKSEVVIYYKIMMLSESCALENEHIVDFKLVVGSSVITGETDFGIAKLQMTLKADNKENFTALELLYKLHQQLANKWSDGHLYLNSLEKNDVPSNQYDYTLLLDFK